MDGVPLVVAHDLHLDVPRADEKLLQVERPVPEGGLGLPFRDLDGLAELLVVLCDPDAASPAAGRRLHHDGVADLLGRLDGLVRRRGVVRAGHDRHVGLARQPAGRRLVAQLLDGLGRGSDKHEAGVLARRREAGVLGQEAVAGVDRLGARLFGGLDQGLHVQVALARRRRADVDRLVGVADVEGLFVGVGVDGDGRDAELLAGADDAQRYLPAVGDQNLLEHNPSAPSVARTTEPSYYARRAPRAAPALRIHLRPGGGDGRGDGDGHERGEAHLDQVEDHERQDALRDGRPASGRSATTESQAAPRA